MQVAQALGRAGGAESHLSNGAFGPRGKALGTAFESGKSEVAANRPTAEARLLKAGAARPTRELRSETVRRVPLGFGT